MNDIKFDGDYSGKALARDLLAMFEPASSQSQQIPITTPQPQPENRKFQLARQKIELMRKYEEIEKEEAALEQGGQGNE